MNEKHAPGAIYDIYLCVFLVHPAVLVHVWIAAHTSINFKIRIISHLFIYVVRALILLHHHFLII